MSQYVHAVDRWLERQISFPKENGQYLIEGKDIEAIVSLIVVEANSKAAEPLDSDSALAIRDILWAMLIEERDPRRALLGSVAVKTDAMTLAGAILLSLSIVAWALNGAAWVSPATALTGASALRLALTAISELTPAERTIIATILAAKKVHNRPFTIHDLLAAHPEAGLSIVTAADALGRLRGKGAISWTGGDEDNIEINKWY